MPKKVELIEIPKEMYLPAGELILLFGHIEWLIANTLLLSEISSTDHKIVKDLPITQRYFETLLRMNFSKKLEELKRVGYDIKQLKEIGDYRNLLSHGLIFKKENAFTIGKAGQVKADPAELSIEKINENIELLKLEGGKLLDFTEAKGYTYHAPA